MLTVPGALAVQHCLKMRSFTYIQVKWVPVRESGGCALLLSCGLQQSFLGKGWEANKVRFTWRRVFTRDRQVVKDADISLPNMRSPFSWGQETEGEQSQGQEERVLSCIPSQSCRQRAAQCSAVRRSRSSRGLGNLSPQSIIIIW